MSWPGATMRGLPSRSAVCVTLGLPTSCNRTANIRTTRVSSSAVCHSGRRASASQQWQVCAQTSPSGCHSGSWWTPIIPWSSGKCSSHPVAARNRNPAAGERLRAAHLNHSSRTRSTASSLKESLICRQSTTVSGAASRPKRPAKFRPRSTRNGSSTNAGPTCRSIRRSKSARPPWKSSNS